MAKKKASKPTQRNVARQMMWAAAIVSAPRYAGAFLSADVVTIEPWLSTLLHWANLLSGLAMGLLEVFASAYILDGLSRTAYKTVKRYKLKDAEGKEQEHRQEVWNMRWLMTLGFALALLVLSFGILSPFMVSRMEGITVAAYLSDRAGHEWWTRAVLAAPILIIGGIAFSQRIVGSGATDDATNVETLSEDGDRPPTFARGFDGFVEYLSWLKARGRQVPDKEQIAVEMARDVRSVERYIKIDREGK